MKDTYKLCIGIDEVGRGAWAGPLVVGAVMFDKPLLNMRDSKMVSKSERERLAGIIQKEARFFGLGWVAAEEINELGLTKATTLAIQRAIEYAPECEQYLIDGSYNYLRGSHENVRVLQDGDANVPVISAASILAKVARDEYMREQAEHFPEYGFENHVGYGTTYHREMLIQHGLTPLHRHQNVKMLRELYPHAA